MITMHTTYVTPEYDADGNLVDMAPRDPEDTDTTELDFAEAIEQIINLDLQPSCTPCALQNVWWSGNEQTNDLRNIDEWRRSIHFSDHEQGVLACRIIMAIRGESVTIPATNARGGYEARQILEQYDVPVALEFDRQTYIDPYDLYLTESSEGTITIVHAGDCYWPLRHAYSGPLDSVIEVITQDAPASMWISMMQAAEYYPDGDAGDWLTMAMCDGEAGYLVETWDAFQVPPPAIVCNPAT